MWSVPLPLLQGLAPDAKSGDPIEGERIVMPTSNDNPRKVENAAAECLRRAKALIPDTEHWWRGPRPRPRNCHCPLTAIVSAARSLKLRKPVANLVYDVIEQACEPHLRPLQRYVPRWNDAPERTLADVHAAFDRAIALAEEGK